MIKQRWLRRLIRSRLIIAVLILIQIGFILYLIIGAGSSYAWVDTILKLMSLYVAMQIVSKNDISSSKLTWVFLILAIPLFGGLMYIMVQTQSSKRRLLKAFKPVTEIKNISDGFENVSELAQKEYPHRKTLLKYLQYKAGFCVYNKSTVEYLSSGEEMFERLLPELESAEHFIFLEYFIIEQGIMWNTVLDILERKAASGVDVRVIYDDVGCFLTLPGNYKKILRAKGIKCEVFNPFRPVLSTVQNNRDHRKIAVIDGITAFTGGNNLADEYINKRIKHGHWKDSAIIIKGEAVTAFLEMFMEMWNAVKTSEQLPVLKKSEEPDDKPSFIANPVIVDDGSGFVQPYSDSPLDKEHVSEHVYMHIINGARDYMYIMTPYLIIDDAMLSALILAAKSGVDVRVITPCIADKRFVHSTTRSYYRRLIEGGVRIFEYTDGFIHSKCVVVDDDVAVVGTCNFDFRSMYLHFECGICFYGRATADVKNDFLQTQSISHEIMLSDCATNPFTIFYRAVLRLFAPLM